MRRPRSRGPLAAIMAVLVAVAALWVAPAAQARSASDSQSKKPSNQDPGRVSVLKAEGLIDPVLANFIEQSIGHAETSGMIAVVIQLDSSGSVLDDEGLANLARTIHDAAVPVAVWVGPSGSVALGGAAQIAGAADIVGLSPGSRLGKTGELVVPRELLSPEFVAAQGRLENGTIDEAQARKLGISPDRRAAVIGEFIIGVDGVQTRVVTQDGRRVTEPVSVPVFSALPIQDQLFHTVASPAAAYLLLLIGLSLIVFELFTAGVGVAGLVGAGCLALSAYGLAVVPVRPVGLVLLILAIVAFTIDVQIGVPRFWSAVGGVSLVAGSILVYDGLSQSWITLLVGIVGTALFMIFGMPAMVRTRFSTPTIGREWMAGDHGEVVAPLTPDGVVRVRGALWPARSVDAGALPSGAAIEVVDAEGVLLLVAPGADGTVSHPTP